jgi:hypothetical protein
MIMLLPMNIKVKPKVLYPVNQNHHTKRLT